MKTTKDKVNDGNLTSHVKKISEYIKESNKDHAASTFASLLEEFMCSYHKKPSEVYTAAFISRQEFSRLASFKRTGNVKKSTVYRLAIGFGLNIKDTERLLSSCGYKLTFELPDLIYQYAIKCELTMYDLFNICQAMNLDFSTLTALGIR